MQEDKKLSSKDFLKTFIWTIKLYLQVFPKYFIAQLTASTLLSFEPLINSFLFAKIIDYLLAIQNDPQAPTKIIYIIIALALLYVTRTLISHINWFTRQQIQSFINPKVRILVSQKLHSLGIQSLENPTVNNLIERSRDHIYQITRQMDTTTSIIGDISLIVGSVAIIISVKPIILPIIFFAVLPDVLLDSHYIKKFWRFDLKITEKRRSAYESQNHVMDSKDMQELTITQGYTYLADRFSNFVDYWFSFITKQRTKWYVLAVIFGILQIIARLFSYALIFIDFIYKKITIGNVTFYIRTIESLSSGIMGLSQSVTSLYESSQRIDELRQLFELTPSFEDGNQKMPKVTTGPGIIFKNVSFKYPSSSKYVIKDLNLIINPGEKIAIVGHNGAGKTTLIKLILRFYQVDKGNVTINNQNINKLKISTLYRNVGVLFQDYNIYKELTALENIFIGRPASKPTKSKIIKAAKKADAHDFIKEYEKGYDQILSEKYKGGTRPSTGQWQKIAIARLFYRNPPLVIFDEPTASIDALSEQRIFNRIYKFFKGKTVIIISHRFSTVRNADRIIVFDKGKIIEQGSHEDLIKLNGKYATAFAIQAKGYSTSHTSDKEALRLKS